MAKICFFQFGEFPNPAALSLAGAAKSANHEFALGIIENRGLNYNTQRISTFIRQENPNLIAFTATTGIFTKIRPIMKFLKKEFSIPILIGGYHASLEPEIIYYDEIDIVCLGEGDLPLIDLLNAIHSKKTYNNIKNLWVKEGNKVYKNEIRPLVKDLDSLPLSDYSIYKRYSYISNGSIGFVPFGRGCNYNCSYCCNHSIKNLYNNKGSFVRFHSLNRIKQECDSFLKVFKKATLLLPGIENLATNKVLLKDLLAEFKKCYDLYLFIFLTANDITEDIINSIRSYNKCIIGMGVESGNQNIRLNTLNKKITDKKIINAAGLLNKYGIPFQAYNIIGIPGENTSQIWDTVHFNQRIKPTYPIATIYTPFPKTDLFYKAVDLKLINKNFDFSDSPLFFSDDSILNIPNKGFITNIRSFFTILVLFPKSEIIIKKLINLPPNILFRFIKYLTDTWVSKNILKLSFYTLFIIIKNNLIFVTKAHLKTLQSKFTK